MNSIKKKVLGTLITTSFVFLPNQKADASETDQYMTWNTELADCSNLFNDKLNEEFIPQFLDKTNEKGNVETREELVTKFYGYLYAGLSSSRIREWLKTSPEVDRFPDNSVSNREFKRESIYKSDVPFPFSLLPMSRTINIDGVYMGIDKLGHFFSFGKRYFKKYDKLVEKGISEEEAVKKTIQFGITFEKWLVGGFVDGVVSYGDLEANYQGFELARDLASAEKPFFELVDGKWKAIKNVDIRNYITPDFDESYNNCRYQRLRKKTTLPIIKKYLENTMPEIAKERFAKYEDYIKANGHSVSYCTIEDRLNKKKHK